MNIDSANKELENKNIIGLLTIKEMNQRTYIETTLAGQEPAGLEFNGYDPIHCLGPLRLPAMGEISRLITWSDSTVGYGIFFGYKKINNVDNLMINMPGTRATEEEIITNVERIIANPAVKVLVTQKNSDVSYGYTRAEGSSFLVFPSGTGPVYTEWTCILRKHVFLAKDLSRDSIRIQDPKLKDLRQYLITVNAPMFKLGISETEIAVRLEGSITGNPEEIKGNISRITSIPLKDITLQIITSK
ncbi:hypothetical protein [Pseudomonas sp. SWRI154]|uniref:hypothetical protein n=1 Tax=Pseudomonas sp. SWRI154 TaxID=2745501 RepID=UPI001646A16D|nr:hypothetical protein [Pseudomonas sp. SWRI154]MBC3364422.1 hypothetical protein [Pseudomonas sp. SWRI154]